MLTGAGSGRGSPWFFRAAAPTSARLRLFCFPCAGFGAAMYRSWPSRMPSGVEVVGVQPPGRANRLAEPPLADFPALVEAILPEIAPLLDRPYAFFGHSMGAVFAAELALALEAEGARAPSHLFLSSRQPPNVPSPVGPLSHLDDAAFVAELNARYAAIPAEILAEPDVLALLLPAARADVRALEAIEGREARPLPAPVTAFGGDADALVSRALLEGWRGWAVRGFRLRLFEGGHFYLGPREAELAAEIAVVLGAEHGVQDRAGPQFGRCEAAE